MNFTSRETYLHAVLEWKERYAQLSQEIRLAKLQVRNADRAVAKAFLPDFYSSDIKALDTITKEQRRAYDDALRSLDTTSSARKSLSSIASEALQERADGKVEAGRQWLAARTKD